MESNQENRKMTTAKAGTKNAQTMKNSKVFSNNLRMSSKTFCCECDKVVTLSGMRKHVKTWHKMTFTAYKELYGNPRMQIIQLVYNKCAFCQSSILFDTEDMSKHMKKKHKTSYKEYITRYMTKPRSNSPAAQLPTPVQKKEPVPIEKKSTPLLVVIRCDQCPRTFKQNIQLKIHKRKHSSLF
jgi:hypothetical protein